MAATISPTGQTTELNLASEKVEVLNFKNSQYICGAYGYGDLIVHLVCETGQVWNQGKNKSPDGTQIEAVSVPIVREWLERGI
jgi:hypothetical protein